MLHHMHLHKEPFNLIREGKQTIESRVNDEKRREVSVGDGIEFVSREDPEESFRVRVIELITKPTFSELYNTHSAEMFGGRDKAHLMEIYKYYSPEEEKEWGVVGIQVQVL